MRYDKVKSSGIDWIGNVPNHWSIKRVKDIVVRIGSGVTPKGGSEVYVNSGVPLLRSQNVYDDGLRIDDVSFIDEATHNKMKSSQLKPNDILINITGASIGRTCIVPQSMPTANINQHIIYIRLNRKLVPYISNYFKTYAVKEYINLIQAGTSKEALNMGQTLNVPVILPPLEEQNQIAQYLDTKTQAIDKKVNLLTKKSDYNKELRKSIINDAVCKGLDKNVKLKESGIEWIGQIPEHWEVKRLKNICDYVNRGTSPSYVEYSAFKVINQATFSKGYLNEEKIQFTDKKNTERGTLKYGDILIASTGGGVLGKTVLFNKSDKNYIADSHVTILRDGRKRFAPSFLHYFFSINFHLINDLLALGSTNQTELQKKDLLALHLAIPPLAEQTEIATYLDTKTQKIDAIVANIQKQIETHTELRKTLINDVITGKIKVTKN